MLKRIIAEGKHWPADYVKTGINMVNGSPIGKQSWYNDEYIAKDMQTFADEFGPLSHKNSNLGFFSTIVKWFIEYSGTSREKYQEFIERKLDGIISALQLILNDPSYDKVKDEIKTKWPFKKFEELQKQVEDEKEKSSAKKIKSIKKTDDYKLIPINSYEELNEKFGGRWTGYKGQSEWCHANGKSTYHSWTKNGTQMFFVLAHKNWKKIKAPNPEETNAYDAYGTSLIAILVDVATSKLLNETLRWNHVIDPSKTNPGATVDKAFKDNYGELSQAVRMDVKAEVEKKIKAKQDKLKKKQQDANAKCEQALKNAKIITDATIPDGIRTLITSIKIPDSVKRIGNYAFSNCTSLTNIQIPNSVESIGDCAFERCDSLTNIEIPDSVKNIRNWTFYNCKSLTNVSIPDSVESIGASAFWNCTSLTNIEIPDSVKSIGDDAFWNSRSLKEAIFKGKTIEEVKEMKNYPWGIEYESIIKAEKQSNLKESKVQDMKTYKSKSGKTYTKKQICEALVYWKKQLKKLDESARKEIDVASPSYYGAPYPKFDPKKVNEKNFDEELRSKWSEMYIENGNGYVEWESQEYPYHSEEWEEEVKRAFAENGLKPGSKIFCKFGSRDTGYIEEFELAIGPSNSSHTNSSTNKSLAAAATSSFLQWPQVKHEIANMKNALDFMVIAVDEDGDELVDGDWAVSASSTSDGVLEIVCAAHGSPLEGRKLVGIVDKLTGQAKVKVGYGDKRTGTLETCQGKDAFVSDVIRVDYNDEDGILNLELKQSSLDEARHDGRWLPSHPTHRNPSEKKTEYFLAVDHREDIGNFGQYIRSDGSLTRDMTNASFASCGKTVVPESLEKMVGKAVQRYGKDYYIFIYQQPYSYGNQTMKNHARPSVIDIWIPGGQYWKYGLAHTPFANS